MTLADARKALGLTQRELDRRAGVSRNTTQDIENGRNKNPSWEVVRSLMAALQRSGMRGLTAEDVFGDATVASTQD